MIFIKREKKKRKKSWARGRWFQKSLYIPAKKALTLWTESRISIRLGMELVSPIQRRKKKEKKKGEEERELSLGIESQSQKGLPTFYR